MRNAILGALALALVALPASANTLALGDSLAVGAGQALHVQTIAKVGASSCDILFTVPRARFETVIISAGTNDPPGSCIEGIRELVHADKVVWILPVNGARSHVEAVAAVHGDKTVSYSPASGRAWPHPKSYKPLADAVRAAL